MNKISKKIVSLVTMAAFALTLVPAAAFATPLDASASNYEVSTPDAGQLQVEVNLYDTADAQNVDYAKVQIVVKNDEGVNAAKISNVTVGATGTSQSATPAVSDLETGVDAGGVNPIYTYSNLPADTYTVEVKVASSADGAFTPISVEGNQTEWYVYGSANAGASYLTIEAGDDVADTVTVNPGTSGKVIFNVTDKNTEITNNGTLPNVYIYAVDSKGQFTDAVSFAETDTTNYYVKSVGASVSNSTSVAVDFNRPGTYTIVAVAADSVPTIAAGLTPEEAFAGQKVYPIGGNAKVTINNYTYVTASFDFNNDNGANADGTIKDEGNNKYTYTINDNVTPNGVKVYTVTGQALRANGQPAAYETLNISANKNGIQLLDNEVGTDKDGKFEFRFTLTRNGEFPITVSELNDGVSATLTVVQNELTPVNISTVKDGGYLLAGNDPTYRAQTDYKSDSFFAGAVQFEVTDGNGKVIEDQPLSTADYKLTVAAPEGSDLENDELTLVWNEANGVYTLAYGGDNVAKDLIPGEYTVKVAFDNSSRAATATFNLAQFGTVQNLAIDVTAQADGVDTNNDNAIRVIDDQVALGQDVTATINYVDENGIEVKAPAGNLNVGVNGSNSASVISKTLNGNPIYFTTAANTASNESLIGTTITIMVMDENTQKYAEKELTIVNAYLDETLSFDPTSGAVDEDNTVTVSVVDADGNVSKVNGQLYAYVESQSNEEANVDVTVDNDVRNGEGELVLYSNAETTADVRVVVVADNGEMYGATLEYTFGAEDPNAQNTVVMTIGSTEYVVNNDVVTGDAAPYVDSNWRTMVPFRVLGETFGAEVNWDQDAQTVTYTLGDTELVMTIGSETYTLNGEEQTMDTAPVIQDSRTMVPVRFVAEDLGYTVTALENADGLTASVVFQK